MKHVLRLFTVLCLAFALGAVAMGQETTGTIEGTVKDPNGAVVPGAQVTVTSAAATSTTGFNRSITANDQGFFRLQGVPPGMYTVATAATGGFGGATATDVEVVLGKTTPVNVTLAVAGQTATVNVSESDVSPIDPTDNKIQTNKRAVHLHS